MKLGTYNPSSYPTPAFVKQELNRLHVSLTKTSGCLMMNCCFHRDNKSPSLSINVDGKNVPPGTFNCFACGASGSWNKLAKQLGLTEWGSDKEATIYVDTTIKEIRQEMQADGLRLQKWDLKWRRYPPEFLKFFKVRKLLDKRNENLYYMWIPLTYSGDIHGYIRVRLCKEDRGPKYFFSPNMTKVLFPGDFLLKYRTPVLILVEGVADALRLIKYKMAACSILGTRLLPIMREQLSLMGVETVIACLDGDKAGRRATRGYKLENGTRIPGILEIIRDLGIRAVDFKLPEENDPDDAPVDVLRDLYKLYKEEGGVKIEWKR